MSEVGVPDFFTDALVATDPLAYYEFVRSQGPVWQEPYYGSYVLTGYDEIVAVHRDRDMFSSCNAFGGPFPGLPEQPEGDDATHLIERFRHVFPSHDSFVTFDPPRHGDHRGLMMGLLTPRRLKENEHFVVRLADELIDSFADKGQCDFIGEYSQPLAMLVIADILGIPESDFDELRRLRLGLVAGRLTEKPEGEYLGSLDELFTTYIDDRRANPSDDVLGKLAKATFEDGRLPEAIEIVRVGNFLFAAGQSTTAQFLGNVFVLLGERPDLQDRLRADPSKIPTFVEEALRLHSSVKVNFRMNRRDTEIAGVHIPAGSTVVMLLPAANRDARRFDHPDELDLDRPNVREHIAFGRGAHSCPGAPLARSESVITVERVLTRLDNIEISSAEHGPPGNRRFGYLPSFIMRGLESLHLTFDAAG
jgi:cytochrome P450